ncbi:MAG TPA: hypothetical protein PKM25_07215, partial [Candidatus Ozemobacteraceae bacterium]|nr:hypothetical protein [Candidatus Ozemobacteraceae bacterium]
MRQTNKSTNHFNLLKGSWAAIAVLLILAGVGTLFADVDGVTLTVDTDPAYTSGIVFNGGAKITLKAAWT